jgi:hypothetical protein
MFRLPTTFILGAGASMPYGYPSGDQLVQQIVGLTNLDAQNSLAVDPQHCRTFQTELKRSHLSIDAFLNNRSEFLEVGKRAIAHCLCYWESSDPLNYERDWYTLLAKRIAPTFDDVFDNKLTIITFNYDRSLEQFLFNWFRSSFGVNDNQAAEAVASISFEHIYGRLSRLPWQSKRDRDPPDEREYGDCDKHKVRQAAEGIKLIYEQRQQHPLFQEVLDKSLRTAESVFILGFGFINENMQWIKGASGRGAVRATCFGLTKAQQNAVKSKYQIGFLEHSDNKANRFLLEDDAFQLG